MAFGRPMGHALHVAAQDFRAHLWWREQMLSVRLRSHITTETSASLVRTLHDGVALTLSRAIRRGQS